MPTQSARTALIRPCEHPLASLLPEEVVSKIERMAFEPHHIAKLINGLMFMECDDYDIEVDRYANGYRDTGFDIYPLDDNTHFLNPRRDKSWRPHHVRHCRPLGMSSYLPWIERFLKDVNGY